MALLCPFWRFFKANVALCHSETLGTLQPGRLLLKGGVESLEKLWGNSFVLRFRVIIPALVLQ